MRAKPPAYAAATAATAENSARLSAGAVRDAASANRDFEPRSRVSPAYALMRHLDALEKHCPEFVRVDDDECHQKNTRSQKLYAEGDHATCMFLV